MEDRIHHLEDEELDALLRLAARAEDEEHAEDVLFIGNRLNESRKETERLRASLMNIEPPFFQRADGGGVHHAHIFRSPRGLQRILLLR